MPDRVKVLELTDAEGSTRKAQRGNREKPSRDSD